MNLLPLGLDAVLVLNVLWFGAGALYFGVAAASAAKLLIPRHARHSPLFKTVSASIRFLGGLNLAFAVLSGAMLFNPALFPEDKQVAALTSILALAHGSQFAANLPVALEGNGRGDAPWPVLSGLMLFIFFMDFTLMLANAAVAAHR